MAKDYWIIKGYKSTKTIFEFKTPKESLSEPQMRATLRALAAKATCEYDEIVRSYINEDSKIHIDHLEVRASNKPPPICLECGVGPHFAAHIVTE